MSYFRIVAGEDLVGGGRGSVEEVGPVFVNMSEVGGGGCRGGKGLDIVVGRAVSAVYKGEWLGHD